MVDLVSPTAVSDAESSKRAIHLRVPRNFLILPPVAALVGFAIGMSRGGSRARLRFLAENAHRSPRTIQGWYFYTKTRNYRVFFAACKTGARYAAGLGGSVALFCALDEGAGWVREQFEEMSGVGVGVGVGATRSAGAGVRGQVREWSVEDGQEDHHGEIRIGLRRGEVHWMDGTIAGMTMGVGLGVAYALPRLLFIRSILFGSILGGTTSALASARDGLKATIEERERQAASVAEAETAPPSHAMVDRPIQPSPAAAGIDGPVGARSAVLGHAEAVSAPAEAEAQRGSSWTSWIPGWGWGR